MKKLIYILLTLFVANHVMAIEPELYSPEGVEFSNETFLVNEIFLVDENVVYKVGTDKINGGEIWKFDGTVGGMERVTNLPEGAAPKLIEIVDGKALFFTKSNEGETVDIWSTNGVDEEVKLIDSFDYRYDEFMFLVYSQSFSYKGNFYFNIYNDEKELFELWRTDGTKEGTLSYSEENNIYDLIDFYLIDDRVVTIGYSDALPGESSKKELYSTDFENERIELAEFENRTYSMRVYNDNDGQSKLFFYDDHSGPKNAAIWVSDGTKNGTLKLHEFTNYEDYEDWSYSIKEYEGNFIIKYEEYVQDSGYANVVIYSDGTKENTLNLTDIVGNNVDLNIREIGKVGNKLLLEASVYQKDQQYIWSTDGTEEGTNLLITAKYAWLFDAVKTNGRLYFPVYKEDGDVVIVESDGTAENINEIVKMNDYLDGEIGSVFTTSINYKGNIIFSVDSWMYYKLNLKTMDLAFIEKLDVVSDHYRLEKYDESLYMKNITKNYYYFNDYRNKFEEIEPNDSDVPLYSIHTTKTLFKDHLYFIADYYGDGHKLYRIDNTFQTISNVEAQPTDELNLYPNPTGDFLNISVDEPTSVSIIDLTGKVVMSIESYSGGGINTSNLPAGVYNIILDENTYGGKFVKK